MAKMIDNKPSYKGEGKVWDSLKENLSNDTVVYNQREINGREFDFCLFLQNKGVLVIEVKGWVADKIKVNGVDDIVVDGYEKPQTSPKKQARAYRFAILNKITSKYNVSPLVLDMVCYPFISKEEYLNVHLDIISDDNYTLFQEDLEDKEKLVAKIENVFNINNLIPHAEFEYDLMVRLRRALEPDFIELNEIHTALPYSNAYIYHHGVNQSDINKMVSNYFGGVKTIAFVEGKDDYSEIAKLLNKSLLEHNVEPSKGNLFVGYEHGISYKDNKNIRLFNFELYLCEKLSDLCADDCVVSEGETTEETEQLLLKLSQITSFNYQQYKIEHASTDKDILVEAGAGTGKTYSMVSRIAFLCNRKVDAVSNIDEEIAMVTFTNDAAINMKKRLKQMFINYFVLTGQARFLKFVEDIDRSNISTIHKFAINILRGESLYTGLGTNFRISSNEYDRGKAYDIFLGEFLEEMESNNPNFINEIPVPIYDLKKKLISIADKLLDKSINFEQIKPSEMGVTVENTIPYFNDLLTKVLFPAEATYTEMMRSTNDVDLKDSLIELNKIFSSGCTKLEDLRTRFLFIDEFQDTDDVQIEIFQKLQKYINANCRLFVVGDLKQSIYRFRGAKLNAFQKLQNGKELEWTHFRLNRNYRTDGRLLAIYDEIFRDMGSQNILPYGGTEDQLESDILTETAEDSLFVQLPCHGKDSEKLLELLNDTILAEKAKIEAMMKNKKLSKEERTIAILVRSNWQIDQVVSAATKKDINIEISSGGDLFQLPSTLDLYKLVLAVQHNTSPVHLINFIESNYTGLSLDYSKLHGMSESEKLEELNDILDQFFERKMSMTWKQVLTEIYTQPVLFALKRIFDSLQPWVNYHSMPDKQRMYIANYEYLMERIIKFSRIDALTLNQITEYLSINILTGQKQLSRSMEVEDEGVHVICTTVHKSKGLEYGTVILPYTSEDISDTKKVKLEANYSDNKLSYTVLFENDIREKNSNYNEEKEINEQIAEEARILYVALTRAIRNCIWINNLDSTPAISWGTILEG